MSFVRFTPRRPIKSFTDLEVYQKLLNLAVTVVKRLGPASQGESLRALVLSLPMKSGPVLGKIQPNGIIRKVNELLTLVVARIL